MIEQEGLGKCGVCGTPIMQALGQGTTKSVCFHCSTVNDPKTGKTVVVTDESDASGLGGTVKFTEVTSTPSSHVIAPIAVRLANSVVIKVTLDELSKSDALIVLLTKLNDALDNMQFSTMKDAKLVMAIQTGIEKKLLKLKGE